MSERACYVCKRIPAGMDGMCRRCQGIAMDAPPGYFNEWVPDTNEESA